MNAADDHVTEVLVIPIMQCALIKFGNAETVMLLLILGRAIRTLKLSSWCDLLLCLILVVYYSMLKLLSHFLHGVWRCINYCNAVKVLSRAQSLLTHCNSGFATPII
jgi:hypothetical protein